MATIRNISDISGMLSFNRSDILVIRICRMKSGLEKISIHGEFILKVAQVTLLLNIFN